ncbi:MAG: alpha/beta hydrolase [Pseudomonadota bacterium]|nr:alpha/beta hydrolase [Pseudomonadota bacterium]
MTLGYETFGNGAHKVVVLHGWFGDQTFMAPMRDALSPNEFTYIFPAYRGYGASKAQSGAYTVEEISADVRALLDSLNLDKVSLVGHSMGGKFIQRIAADAPGRVRRMVAITPVPAAAVPFDEQGWGLFHGAAENLGNRRGIIDFSTGARLSAAWLDHMAQASWENCTRAAFAGYLTAWAKSDFHPAVVGSAIPIKVIIGQHDGAINEATMQATFMAWYKNATLEVTPNAGHYPMNETPVALATSMEAFLRG